MRLGLVSICKWFHVMVVTESPSQPPLITAQLWYGLPDYTCDSLISWTDPLIFSTYLLILHMWLTHSRSVCHCFLVDFIEFTLPDGFSVEV